MAAVLADGPRDRAFEELYELHAPEVYRYALAVLRNPADAEDVTQTTFMNAYRAFKGGERPRMPRNWLIAIAHNACRTRAIRASRRPREVPLDDVVRKIAVSDQDKPNVREALSALSKLPFNQRAAIAMRELEGRSYTEIAQTLGVSVSAVEALLVRGRRSLKLRRAAVRGLAVLELPRSLRKLFAHADKAGTAGGAIAGSGAVAKVAAVLVAGAVAGGTGYKVHAAPVIRAPAHTRVRVGTHPHTTRRAGAVLRSRTVRARRGAMPAARSGTAASAILPANAAGRPTPPTDTAGSGPPFQSVPSAPVEAPPVPVPHEQAPPVQTPPVQTPPVQTPPVPAPPEATTPEVPTPQVTIPQLPSAPALPPAPVTATLPQAPSAPAVP